jgi:predicted MPP superfamily phosphohydrolase
VRYLAIPIMISMIMINAYIGFRLWRRFFQIRFRKRWVLAVEMIVLQILTLIFWIPRFAEGLLPHALEQALYWIGGCWMCADLYLMLFILFLDILWLCRRRKKPWSEKSCQRIYGGMLGLVLIVVILAVFQANQIHVTPYQIQLEAPQAQNDEFHIALISDIHLGTIWGAERVEKIVSNINALKPDLVLISGDLLDAGIDAVSEKEQIVEAFQKLEARYGVYACLGNHDSGFGVHAKPQQTVAFLERCGIKILLDEGILLDNGVFLAGRIDPTMEAERKTPEQLLQGYADRPVIMLDHQPPTRWKSWWQEAEEAGADLILSGHTHNGQIFPGNILLEMISTCSYGYWKGSHLQAIVTSGIGTWGPTARMGTKSEIVFIEVKTTKSASGMH